MVSAVPEGMDSVIPYLVVPNAQEAIDFYAKAFGAESVMHMPGPGGQGTMHAEIRMLGSVIMLCDEMPQWGMKSAQSLGGSPVSMMYYCENVDEVFGKAIEAGCEVIQPPSDMFWGDRMTKVSDPYGLHWSIATHTEDVPPEEMPARQQKWMEEMAAAGGECEGG